jgi:hypothetical protein
MSLTSHSAIARFLAAAHRTMLKWLKEEQQRSNFDGEALREWWHAIMEQSAGREKRREFFTEVLAEANAVSQPIPHISELKLLLADYIRAAQHQP